MTQEVVHPVSPSVALERLREGNARFVRELRSLEQAVNRVVLVVPILCDPRQLPP